jgi:RNA methyltransferase, TrmH family
MTRATTIASAANPLVKDVRRAIARGALTAGGLCVAETFHLLEEALASDCEVPYVLAAESALLAAEALACRRVGIKVAGLPEALFESLSATENSQGVMALVKPPVWNLEDLFRGQPLVVLLDGLQDPGNAGSIVRAAEAFGATGVLFLKGAVSPYNPKTLRASAGSLFRLPFLHPMEPAPALAALRAHRVELYAAVPPRAGATVRPLAAVDLSASCALIVGSEAHGVSAGLRAAAQGLSIPTTGVESLNAAVAAGILLYEARRQRALVP